MTFAVRLASLFLKQKKLTGMLVFLLFVWWVVSYLQIPKQYNPDITVPAFAIIIPAPEYDARTLETLITSPLEDVLSEIEDIDIITSQSRNQKVFVSVQFRTGTSKETAKTRLMEKIQSRMLEKPLFFPQPIILSIDPDELPQITFAITAEKTQLNQTEKELLIRQTALLLRENLRTLPHVTRAEIIGGQTAQTNIEIQPNELQTLGLSLPEAVQKLQEVFAYRHIGITQEAPQSHNLNVIGAGHTDDLQTLRDTSLWTREYGSIRMSDIAKITVGTDHPNKGSFLWYKEWNETGKNREPVAFLALSREKGTNTKHITDSIVQKVEQTTLPTGVTVRVIQNEGDTAQRATDGLMQNLFEGMAIVFVILLFSLGFRNALNAAIVIPLTFFVSFFIAGIMGENLNRISLFALILVLGMIVDDSIVVVENINRHRSLRKHTGKSLTQAILDAVAEVETSVVLSTVTRLLSFGSMLFVWDMMGQYMAPIPKFALITFLVSLFFSLTVNPWLSTILSRDTDEHEEKNGIILDRLLTGYKKFLTHTFASPKRVWYWKKGFWIAFFVIIIVCIGADVLRLRMLPKSNQNQVYVWIDAPRNTPYTTTEWYAQILGDTLITQKTVSSVSISIGQKLPDDFANLFRGGSFRQDSWNITARVNLIDKDQREQKSEELTQQFRAEVLAAFRNHPELTIRLLEDPAGPPTQSTLRIYVQPEQQTTDPTALTNDLMKILEQAAPAQGIVDIGSSHEAPVQTHELRLKHQDIQEAGISPELISSTLQMIYNDTPISTDRSHNAEETHITLTVPQSLRTDPSQQLRTLIPTPTGMQPLSRFVEARSVPEQASIAHYKKQRGDIIFAELGNSSIIYPIMNLFWNIVGYDILSPEWSVEKWSLYDITLHNAQGEKITLRFDGEWKITLDTFRDLGAAMMVSLFLIWIVLVLQFQSFFLGNTIMKSFLLGFFGIFPGFSILYLLTGEYFSATAMIGVIALGGIAVGNAVVLLDYFEQLAQKMNWNQALIEAGAVRLRPIFLTSITAILWASTMVQDPVWSGLAWAIIFGLSINAVLTLIFVPLFLYQSQEE